MKLSDTMLSSSFFLFSCQMQDTNSDDVDRGFKTVPSSWMTFTVSSADVKTSDSVPDADVSLRLEHSSSGQRLYLHNTESRKPQSVDKADVSASSDCLLPNLQLNTIFAAPSQVASNFSTTSGLVFSTVRSSQDIFKLFRVNKLGGKLIQMSKLFLVPAATYTVGASKPDFDPLVLLRCYSC
jgi:hypothetical protein